MKHQNIKAPRDHGPVRWIIGLELLCLASLCLGGDLLYAAVGKPAFKPGYNFYSPQEDAQLGKEYSVQVDKQLPLLKETEVLQYLTTLGRALVAYAPHNQAVYAWQFRIVNRTEINAFALPGGYIYVNRGVFDVAEDEAQLAGVIAHEAGHVVMRHGTHIASAAILAQGGLAILGGVFGQTNSLTGQLAQMGLGLGVDSLLLKNSRTAEAQADEVGAYILYQAGYDPRALPRFFQIIEEKYPERTIQFFSDHPNPQNRIKDVDAEIAQLGPGRGLKTDSPEFEAAKRQLSALPPPPRLRGTPKTEVAKQPPPPPSENWIHLDGKDFSLEYPDNWQIQRDEDGITLFPPGGIVTGAEGETSQAYGAALSRFQPQAPNWGLVDATQELLESMRQSNPQMHVVQQTGMSLNGNPAISTLLQNESPIQGQRETDHLVTTRLGDAVLTIIFIAPTGEFGSYAATYDNILQTVQFTK